MIVSTKYIEKFAQLQIVKHVPDGIDPLYHINTRKEVYEMVLKILNNKKEAKLSYIKMLIMDYKSLLGAKFTLLN